MGADMKIDFNEFKNLCSDAEGVIVYYEDEDGDDNEFHFSVAFEYGHAVIITDEGIQYDFEVVVKEDGKVVILDILTNVIDLPEGVDTLEAEDEVKDTLEAILDYGNWHKD